MSTEILALRILLIGQKPETVNFQDPNLPYGFSVNTIYESLAKSIALIEERGWVGERLVVLPDGSAYETTKEWLQTHPQYDCIVIGAGVRLPAYNLRFFESVINAVHNYAPHTPIGFNTRPEETADIAAACIAHYKK